MLPRTTTPHRLARLRAALALRGQTVASLARVVGRHRTHVIYTVAGERQMSADLRAAIEAALGPAAAAFVFGQSDNLHAEVCS
jgi:plasmid maintenance system antidote protein VapI